MKKANQDLRKAAKAHSVSFWQVANEMDISEATMTRKLRTELQDKEKMEILSVIKMIGKGGRENADENNSSSR